MKLEEICELLAQSNLQRIENSDEEVDRKKIYVAASEVELVIVQGQPPNNNFVWENMENYECSFNF